MNDKTIIKLVGISLLTLLEVVALLLNLDGAFFLPVVAAISGLAGYEIQKTQMQEEEYKSNFDKIK